KPARSSRATRRAAWSKRVVGIMGRLGEPRADSMDRPRPAQAPPRAHCVSLAPTNVVVSAPEPDGCAAGATPVYRTLGSLSADGGTLTAWGLPVESTKVTFTPTNATIV